MPSRPASTSGRSPAARDVGQLRAVVEAAHRPAATDDGVTSARSRARRSAGVEPVRRGAAGAADRAGRRPAAADAAVRVDARGGPRAPDDLTGPVVFAANHQSYIDTAVILAALPPRWRYRVATGDVEGVLRGLVLSQRPVVAAPRRVGRRVSPGGAALRRLPAAAAASGAHGGRCATSANCSTAARRSSLFPEGEITDTGAISWFRPGVGMIAAQARRDGRAGAARGRGPRAASALEDGPPGARAGHLRRAAPAGRRRLHRRRQADRNGGAGAAARRRAGQRIGAVSARRPV